MKSVCTCDLVHQDARGDDASVLGEQLLHVLLAHGLGEAADVEVGVTDGRRAGPGVGHLGRGHMLLYTLLLYTGYYRVV